MLKNNKEPKSIPLPFLFLLNSSFCFSALLQNKSPIASSAKLIFFPSKFRVEKEFISGNFLAGC